MEIKKKRQKSDDCMKQLTFKIALPFKQEKNALFPSDKITSHSIKTRLSLIFENLIIKGWYKDWKTWK